MRKEIKITVVAVILAASVWVVAWGYLIYFVAENIDLLK